MQKRIYGGEPNEINRAIDSLDKYKLNTDTKTNQNNKLSNMVSG